jgi:hypothetical protein
LIGGALLVYALTTKVGGYTFDKLPHVFVRVFADLLR